MNKTFSILLKTVTLFLFPLVINAQNAVLTADFPSSVHAGEVFMLSIHVDKGPAAGNAKLQLDLPVGFIAKNVNSRRADFIIENNFVKFIWNTLPDEKEFTVSLNLTVNGSISGKQTINGEFVYSNGDQAEHVTMQPCIINVNSEQQATAGIKPASSEESKQASPKVERKIISVSDTKGEYRVELTFYPNSINESAQFTDILPADYSALIIDAHEASYSFENQSVIFSWKKFPTEKSFTISYLVRTTSPGTAPVINGTLVYGDAVEVSPLVVSQLPTTNGSPSTSSATSPNSTTTPTPETPAKSTDAEANKTESTQPETPKEAPKSETKEELAVASTNTTMTNSDVSSNTNGIYFRVQISATQKSTDKDSKWFAHKYAITHPVELTYDEGWKKYLIGSFNAYSEAASFKNETREKVSDAFIVAYQNGKRIPVSEAIRNKAINQ